MVIVANIGHRPILINDVCLKLNNGAIWRQDPTIFVAAPRLPVKLEEGESCKIPMRVGEIAKLIGTMREVMERNVFPTTVVVQDVTGRKYTAKLPQDIDLHFRSI